MYCKGDRNNEDMSAQSQPQPQASVNTAVTRQPQPAPEMTTFKSSQIEAMRFNPIKNYNTSNKNTKPMQEGVRVSKFTEEIDEIYKDGKNNFSKRRQSGK